MPQPIELFSYWTRRYSVTLVPPDNQAETPALLRFQRKLGRQDRGVSDLFETWFARPVKTRNVKTAMEPIHLNAIVSISRIYFNRKTDELESQVVTNEAILKVAEQLGPILTVLPSQSPNVIHEPLDKWQGAAEALVQLINAIEKMQKASRDSSKTARKRQGFKKARYNIDIFDFLPLRDQKSLARSYRPAPGISARNDAEARVAEQIDSLWFLPLQVNEEYIEDIRLIEHLRFPRLRLSDKGEGRTMQLNVPFGIQALLIMLLYDQTIGQTLFPRKCARTECQKLVLMGPRRYYCSDKCQRSAAAKRHRQEAKRTRARSRKVTQSTSQEG